MTELKTWIETQLFFSTKGSGSLAAMAVFEDRYKPDMEVSTPLTCHSLQTKQTTMFLTLILCRFCRRRRPSSWCGMPSLQVSLMTWALAATLTCVLSPRARWTTCGPMMRPTRRASGENWFICSRISSTLFSFDSLHTQPTGWNKLLICCHGEVYFQTLIVVGFFSCTTQAPNSSELIEPTNPNSCFSYLGVKVDLLNVFY